jgi:SepF-like predicted cell division protein (DUF552 family)
MKTSEFRKLIREEVRRVLKEKDSQFEYPLYQYRIGKNVYTLNGKKIYIAAAYYNKDDAMFDLQDIASSPNSKDISKALSNLKTKKEIMQQISQYPDNEEVYLAKVGDPNIDKVILLTPQEVKQIKGKPSQTLGGKVPANTLVLVMDEDNVFSLEKLKGYDGEDYLNLDGPLIPTKDVADYPESQGAASSSQWKAAVAKLGTKYKYYDVLSELSDENCVVAAVPKA